MPLVRLPLSPGTIGVIKTVTAEKTMAELMEELVAANLEKQRLGDDAANIEVVNDTTTTATRDTGETMSKQAAIIAAADYQFTRLFGDVAVSEIVGPDDDRIHFAAGGWPESHVYDCRLAAEVLGKFPTGHGTTEAGDAEVCAELKAAGAVL